MSQENVETVRLAQPRRHRAWWVQILTFSLWTLSNGMIVSCITYDEHADALEGAGLRE